MVFCFLPQQRGLPTARYALLDHLFQVATVQLRDPQEMAISGLLEALTLLPESGLEGLSSDHNRTSSQQEDGTQLGSFLSSLSVENSPWQTER
jgi:hypothetical protein